LRDVYFFGLSHVRDDSVRDDDEEIVMLSGFGFFSNGSYTSDDGGKVGRSKELNSANTGSDG
jgi:hypothetical protein